MPTEDEVNSYVRQRRGDGPNAPLDAEANVRVRIRVKDLRALLEQLDYTKEYLFPGTNTKIGISGIRKSEIQRPRLIQSDVSFRGKKNKYASFVLESMLARFLR